METTTIHPAEAYCVQAAISYYKLTFEVLVPLLPLLRLVGLSGSVISNTPVPIIGLI